MLGAARLRGGCSTGFGGWNIAAMIRPGSSPCRAAISTGGGRRGSSTISSASWTRRRLGGEVGIAHTRWATHGAPTLGNAHPHIAGPVALVHNGIIENFKPLRDELIADGRSFLSETDSEVVAHLVAREVEGGTYAAGGGGDGIAAASRRVRDRLPVPRPSRAGDRRADGGAADGWLRRGGKLPRIGRAGAGRADAEDRLSGRGRLGGGAQRPRSRFSIAPTSRSTREIVASGASADKVDKGNHAHFMRKEIFEQPIVVAQTLAKLCPAIRGDGRAARFRI